MAFIAELIVESIEFIFLAAVAVAGVFAGIALRKNKDRKSAEQE